MAKITGSNVIGGWSFLIGVFIAIVLGAFQYENKWLSIAYVILGLIIGVLNITTSEVKPFLMSGAILIVVSSIGGGIIAVGIPQLGSILVGLLSIFVPATIIVAIKNVFTLARS